MPKAPRLCPGVNGTCTNVITHSQRHCPDHQPKPWQGRTTGQGSTRASRAARLKCLQDAGYRCQLRYDGCTSHATHADHKVNIASTGQARREATNPDDMQAACEWCHGIKTRHEARAARTYRTNKRPPEPHPGLIHKRLGDVHSTPGREPPTRPTGHR